MTGMTTWRLGRVGGIEIKIDPSWTFIAALVGYSFFLVLREVFPDRDASAIFLFAAIMALVFFASVLLHELAHSWVARARGVEVKGITLFLFGGATEADLDTEDPEDELVIAAVGPVTSLVIAGLFWLISSLSGEGPVGFAAGYLGWINLALAIFNLLPGFPLDGGRVLRSIVWRSTGDQVRATRVGAQAGRIVGMLVIALGLFEVLFLNSLVGGLWLVAIGWFLMQAAAASFLQLQVRQLLAGVPASRVMTREIATIPAETTVQEAIDEYFMRHNYNAFPVTEGSDATGILTLASVRAVPRERWADTRVSDIDEPLSEMFTVAPGDSIEDVVPKLMQGDVGRVVVIDDGDVVGLITPRDLVRWLERSRELEGLVTPRQSVT